MHVIPPAANSKYLFNYLINLYAQAKAPIPAEKPASNHEETATAAISILAAAVLVEASDAEEASLAVAVKKSKKDLIKVCVDTYYLASSINGVQRAC